MTPEHDITELLREWRAGDGNALHKLTPMVYDQLRTLADRHLRKERADHTLQPTALVHEAFLRLAGGNQMDWQDRNHFFSVAAKTMRRVLVDHARAHYAGKRGGAERLRVDLDEETRAAGESLVDLLALDEAMLRLAEIDERRARMIELHHFGGLGVEEIGNILGVSASTVSRNLAAAEAWLQVQLKS